MSNAKALEFFALDKENFESYFIEGFTLTDEQWASIADEIDGRVANYLDELLATLVQQVEEGDWDE
ncbi:hypothetical protein UFOVP222_117 [uncultured Caudovirales phage]|uniref:Uncharacterized protein n=1 Tax=uncultured Caudovirales phage TaxID=2100421 RepID=A0A6J7WSB0_9CAUD|nr:hypothetical protein UFOVP108_112 [uncultured Caudovirales phage]CAB5219708.1 hypothetical protein UFOVP222_117 [uncultured Caudovirales phage]